MSGHHDEAKTDAKDTAREFLDEIIEALTSSGEASNDLFNDYSNGDAYHHETHVDRSYSLLEAAELLDELHQYEETDTGLWQGQAPRKAIATQAAYTYGAAVLSLWQDLIKDINNDGDVQAAMTAVDDAVTAADADEENEALANAAQEARSTLQSAVESVIDAF